MSAGEEAAAPAKRNVVYYIDVFPNCNLRCPSCYVGTSLSKQHLAKGLMEEEKLREILVKAKEETNVRFVGLYNWTEPLLHPRIVDLIGVVKSLDIKCHISSNLNVLRDPEALMQANPDWIRISLSGFTQPIYEIGHKEGDIEAVKQNMIRLAQAKVATGSTTDVTVFFHRYTYNKHEEAPMAAFARELGFKFETFNAYVTTVEKILAMARGRVTPEDTDLLDKLVVPLDQALAITSQTPSSTCMLIEGVIALDVKGDVMLCCGCSSAPTNKIANYLDMPFSEIQDRRRAHRLCGPCLDLGVPKYYLGGQQFAAIAR